MTEIGFVPPAILEPTVVLIDTPCRKCQYDLRSLSVEGRCPECGTPVGLSIRGDLLRYSDPAWLHMLRRGITFVIAAVVFGILAGVLGGVGAVVLHSSLPALLVNLVTAGLYLLGGWFLTMPDPSGLGEDKYGKSRQIIRIALFTGIAGHLITLVQQTPGIHPVVRSFLTLFSALVAIISVIGQFATLNYLGKLALRIPDYEIAKRARFLMYAIGISYGVLACFGLVAALIGFAGGMGGTAIGLGCVAGLAGLALLVFGVMYLFMLGKLGRRFGEAETLAQQTWGTALPVN
jgi:hypothetical protein